MTKPTVADLQLAGQLLAVEIATELGLHACLGQLNDRGAKTAAAKGGLLLGLEFRQNGMHLGGH
jgi:hypothetical protein